jgi:hypothetical protein
MVKFKFTVLALLPLLMTGCQLMGQHAGSCKTCNGPEPQQPFEVQAPPVDPMMSRELADAKYRVSRLGTELNDVRSERDSLMDRLARLQKEREITLASVTNANQEVGVTRAELDRASRDIGQIRAQMQNLIDEVSSLDSMHANQIDQFSRRLDAMVNEYDGVAGPGRSQPLGQVPAQPPMRLMAPQVPRGR